MHYLGLIFFLVGLCPVITAGEAVHFKGGPTGFMCGTYDRVIEEGDQLNPDLCLTPKVVDARAELTFDPLNGGLVTGEIRVELIGEILCGESEERKELKLEMTGSVSGTYDPKSVAGTYYPTSGRMNGEIEWNVRETGCPGQEPVEYEIVHEVWGAVACLGYGSSDYDACVRDLPQEYYLSWELLYTDIGFALYEVTSTCERGRCVARPLVVVKATGMPQNRSPTVRLTWTPLNPVEGDLITVEAIATDPDGDELRYQWTINGHEWPPSADATIFVGPPKTGASYEVSVLVTDGRGGEARANVTITVGEKKALASVYFVHGEVWVTRGGVTTRVQEAQNIFEGDRIHSADPNSLVRIQWKDIDLRQEAAMGFDFTIEKPRSATGTWILKIRKGIHEFFSPKETLTDWDIQCLNSWIGVKGTTFTVDVDDELQIDKIYIEEGSVEVTPMNPQFPPFTLHAGEEAHVTQDEVVFVDRDVPPSGYTHTYGSVAGWYMISVPLPTNAPSGVTIYRWNPGMGMYEVATVLEAEYGYWARLGANTTLAISGSVSPPTSDVTIPITSAGWHQISAPWPYSIYNIQVVKGSQSNTWADAAVADWIRADVYGYRASDGEYTITFDLDPWYGYWMKAEVPGLTLRLYYASREPSGALLPSSLQAPFAPSPVGVPPLPYLTPGSSIVEDLGFSNIPNPVVDVYTTSFVVSGTAVQFVQAVKVEIFNLSGRLVYEEQKAGTTLDWHTVNNAGEYLANGVYLYRMYALINGRWVESEVKELVIVR